MRESYSASMPVADAMRVRTARAAARRTRGNPRGDERRFAGMKFAAQPSGLRESAELAILVASVGTTALRVDRPSIDARPDQ